MTKLKKKQIKDFEELKSALQTAREDLEAALKNSAARVVLEPLVEAYNDARVAAKDFCSSVKDEIEEYVDGKSEAWQEGDKGEAFKEWSDSWGEAADTLDETLEFDTDGGVQLPDDPGDVLDELETEPSV